MYFHWRRLMSERKKPRLALIGLLAVALIGSAAFYFSKTDESKASEALDKAKTSQKLQSLAELDGKAPSHRNMNVQSWTTAEGAKVLFVEARQQPGRQCAWPGPADQCHAQRRRGR